MIMHFRLPVGLLFLSWFLIATTASAIDRLPMLQALTDVIGETDVLEDHDLNRIRAKCAAYRVTLHEEWTIEPWRVIKDKIVSWRCLTDARMNMSCNSSIKAMRYSVSGPISNPSPDHHINDDRYINEKGKEVFRTTPKGQSEATRITYIDRGLSYCGAVIYHNDRLYICDIFNNLIIYHSNIIATELLDFDRKRGIISHVVFYDI